jgi:hypothetical protein
MVGWGEPAMGEEPWLFDWVILAGLICVTADI